ncbi:MAG: hypothetical protein RJA07_817 [Bacteroidota bacterium]|jgi:hypothetical protein
MKYWFNQLIAIPATTNSAAYKRLKRIWNDRTRFHGAKTDENRYHELFSTKHETNLTVALWENFALFEPEIWIKELYKFAEIDLPITNIVSCNWSYEWEKKLEKGIRLCDVVIKFIDSNDVEYLLVVESKNLNKPISDKDTNPEYYLGVEDFERFNENKFLIYCIDETVKEKVAAQILPSKYKTGIITWQELAVVQFNAVAKQNFNDAVKGFICGSILNQFLSKSITPKLLPFAYLQNEPSQKQVDIATDDVQTSADRERKYWNE